jgi:two-component system cell cycle sensor histidine kinase/response regulator CckA
MATLITKTKSGDNKDDQGLLHDLVASVRAIVWRCDARTFRFTFVSHMAEQILGYPTSLWTSDPEFWASHIHPEDRERVVNLCAESTRQLQDHEFEYRMIAADGRVVWLRDIVNVKAESGKPTELTGVMIDISGQKDTQETLRTSEERFFKAFRSNPESVAITTMAHGRFIEVNDAFLRAHGYERSEVIGKTAIELGVWANPEDRTDLLKALHAGAPVLKRGVSFRIRSGKTREVELSAEIIQLQGEPCLLCITHDVTEQKQLEDQLRQASKMDALGKFAGGVAHDFNNLLGIMLGYCELLMEKLAPDDLNRVRVERILEAGGRAAGLTGQLLAFSRRQVLQTEILDMNVVVAEAEKLLHVLLGAEIELVVNRSANMGEVMADSGQIIQVILNLAVNARDAMPNGGKLIIETANVAAGEAGYAAAQADDPHPNAAYVVLTVRDTGTGMDAQTQAHIFEPFFTTKQIGKGTGLGLSTVYGIVKQSGGFISVKSAPGKGTTFNIYLPRITPGARPVASVAKPEAYPGGTETILLVEDEEALRNLTRASLEEAGYKVVEAQDGKDALRLMEKKTQHIDLLLTDVAMPNMSGPELAARLQTMMPGLPTIYTSGNSGNRLDEKRLREAGDVFLQKPYPRHELLLAIRQLMSNKES